MLHYYTEESNIGMLHQDIEKGNINTLLQGIVQGNILDFILGHRDRAMLGSCVRTQNRETFKVTQRHGQDYIVMLHQDTDQGLHQDIEKSNIGMLHYYTEKSNIGMLHQDKEKGNINMLLYDIVQGNIFGIILGYRIGQ